jgi:hypothetical protein
VQDTERQRPVMPLESVCGIVDFPYFLQHFDRAARFIRDVISESWD